MNFTEFCRHLQLEGAPEALTMMARHFDESAAACTEYPRFLRPVYWEKYLPWTGCAGTDILPRMYRLAARAETDRTLQLYAFHMFQALYRYDDTMYEVGRWPGLESFLGEDCGVWDLMIGLGAVAWFETTYRELGLPAHYAMAAATWIGGAVAIYRAGHDGSPGINRKQLFWLRFYGDGTLFRVGRFEYREEPDHTSLPLVFRHRQTRQVTMLCREGWQLDAAGFQVTPESGKPVALVCKLQQDGNNRVTGTPIVATGRALPQNTVTLELTPDGWERAVLPEDFIPGVHIPGGGGMTPEAVRVSLLEAREFYRTYFGRELKAVKCESWILNPDLESELPDSNLAKLMREVYLYPCRSWERDGLFFVFGREDGDPLREYRFDNSLRQAMGRLLQRDALRSGGMLLFAEDFEHFGQNNYRH